MSYISVQLAAEQLDCTVACLFRDAPKYRPFLRKSTKGNHDAGFNLSGFLEAESLKEELTEKTKLLTEYLHHIEGMKYYEIENISGVTQQSIGTCIFGFDAALKIARAIKKKYPYEFKRFEIYYGWKK